MNAYRIFTMVNGNLINADRYAKECLFCNLEKNKLGCILTMRELNSSHTGLTAIENVNTIDERGSKIVRNSVFDCHLSPDWRQMAIENIISSDF